MITIGTRGKLSDQVLDLRSRDAELPRIFTLYTISLKNFARTIRYPRIHVISSYVVITQLFNTGCVALHLHL